MIVLGYMLGASLLGALVLCAIGPEILASWIDHANNKE